MQKMQIWVQSSAHTMTELVRGFAAFFKLTRYTTSDAQHHTSAQQVTRAVQETPEVAAEVAGGLGPEYEWDRLQHYQGPLEKLHPTRTLVFNNHCCATINNWLLGAQLQADAVLM
jgi:hypothetical protein